MTGYTGTNFERPSFKKMLMDIEGKVINTVITKDLSRLGRNYAKTGYYIDEYFPEHQIRYVAVNDSVDTYENEDNSTSAFMGVVNDLYAKDISKKVRTAFKIKQQRGDYLGTSAPFGYMKDEKAKGKLLIDPYSSLYVKRIFAEFLDGKPIHSIALDLIRDSIPTPSEYSKVKNTQRIVAGAWSDTTIRRILVNEVYIGHVIQNKKQSINYKIRKQRANPKEKWVRVENRHEPIINLNDFNTVKQILMKRSYIPKKGIGHTLTGFLFCSNCGSRVTFLPRHEKGKYYCICNVAKNFRKIGKCDMGFIHEEEIEKQIKTFLSEMGLTYLNRGNAIEKTYQEQTKKILIDKQHEKKIIMSKIEENSNLQYELYKDKVVGNITQDCFLSLQIQSAGEREKLEQRLIVIDNEIDRISNVKNDDMIDRAINEFLKFKKLDRNILSVLIDKITVYKNANGEKNINIYCKFQSPK
ncbi:MAG: recombinase family protein [Clostridia bacterium]|nr:recombinase family protein [Clostridia bacterium]